VPDVCRSCALVCLPQSGEWPITRSGEQHPPRWGRRGSSPQPAGGVPRFQQRDSAQLAQRDRTCFSSGCAMPLEVIKQGTLNGPNGDNLYLAVVQHLVVADGKRQTSGDSTDASAQLQALGEVDVSARLVQNADFQLIEQQIALGFPVPCGSMHCGPVERSTGSGHWLIVYGHTHTLNANGMGVRFSRAQLRQALDGGAHWGQCLPLCPGQALGSGGGQHPLRHALRGAFSATVGAGG
jgi:diadenosine tetraphosphatase ApaH/serine/threonine PP2A family protein phosphatase